MLSLRMLAQMNEEAEVRHKKSGLLVLVDPADVHESIRLPFLGSRVPEGWRRIDFNWFVDMTGLGGTYEQALTQEQFLRSLKCYVAENPGLGYAIFEMGQFQARVGVYVKC